MRTQRFDVAVVGAGPAGASAAVALSRRGYRVVVIDRAAFPRDKLCGDFLSPLNWPVLAEMEAIDELFQREHAPVTGFRVTSADGGDVSGAMPAGASTRFALGIRRFHLDDVLLRRAVHEGATVMQGRGLKGLSRHCHGWLVQTDESGSERPLLARFLVGADGRNSKTARLLGALTASPGKGETVGFQAHLRAFARLEGHVEIHLFPGGYAGLVAVGPDTVNLCCAIRARALPDPISFDSLRDRLFGRNCRLAERLAGALPVGNFHWTSPVYFQPRRCFGDGFVLAGDAARVSEPVTGEGIHWALKSGRLAAAAIDRAFRSGDLSARETAGYAQACEREFALRARANGLLRFLIYRPGLMQPLIRCAAARGRVPHGILRFFCSPASLGAS